MKKCYYLLKFLICKFEERTVIRVKNNDKLIFSAVRETEVYNLTAKVVNSALIVNGVSDINALKGSTVKVRGNSICTFSKNCKGILSDRAIGIAESGSTVIALDNAICYAKEGSKVFGHSDSVIVKDNDNQANIVTSERSLVINVMESCEDIEYVGSKVLCKDILDDTIEKTKFAKGIQKHDLIVFNSGESNYYKDRYITSYRGFYGLIFCINTLNKGHYNMYYIHNSKPVKRVRFGNGINFAVWDVSTIKVKFFKKIYVDDNNLFRVDL